MRFLLRAELDMAKGNAAFADGTLPHKMHAILEAIKPEAVYFGLGNGNRTMYAIVNFDNASEMPGIAEPLWLAFDAKVETIPVMTREDLGKASASFGEIARRFGG
jgi:hypothetical protein